MRRSSLSFALIVVVLLGVVLTGRLPHAAIAQSATPTGPELPAGASAQPLAFGAAPSLPSPADLVLVRLTLQPGTVLPNDPTDPSVALAYVESGALTLHFNVPVQITRTTTIAAFATPNATVPGPDVIAANATATLNAGDSVVGPPNVGGDVRNDGSGPAVVLLAIIAPAEMGTPEATPAA